MRLAILASHPIQYQAPLFRALARRHELTVFFAHRATETDQANAGFGVGFDWDVDLLSGYDSQFLDNVSSNPGLDHFGGCDVPSVNVVLKNGSFTALLVMGWHLKCYWQGIWASKRARIPVMVRGDSHLGTRRGIFKRAAKNLVYPLALRVFDTALYVGERSRRYWTHYGYPQERLFFSPHCIDNDWFAKRATEAARREFREQHGIGADGAVVLFVGKLLPFKRPQDLIAAAKALATRVPDPTVLIAGSGPLASKLSDAATTANVRLVQMGFCNQSALPSLYAASDLLVLPSSDETWGLVANEALACGKPIIVSDACGCAPDLAADGSAGRVFPVGDVAALADAIADVLEKPPVPEAIAAKASAFSSGAAAAGISEAFERVTNHRGLKN